MTYMKAQRHRIYEAALTEQMNPAVYTCICLAISAAMHELKIEKEGLVTESLETWFPEVWSFKPETIGSSLIPWWSQDDKGTKKRIEVLKQCIKMTAPVKRKRK